MMIVHNKLMQNKTSTNDHKLRSFSGEYAFISSFTGVTDCDRIVKYLVCYHAFDQNYFIIIDILNERLYDEDKR